MLMEDKYLTVDEVAERMRVSPWTVRSWIKNGRLAAIKPGQQFLISESSLESFLKAAQYDSVN